MWAILWKDLLLELRTKERVSSLLVLALLIILVFVFALTPEQLHQPAFGSALLWVALVFAGMLSIHRAFILEQERNCFAGLLLCPIDPGQVFFAKFLSNVCFLAIVEAVVAPLTLALLGLPFSVSLLGLPLVLLCGIVGFSALGTLCAAIAVRTRAREIILPLMLLPLLVPLFIAAVNVTGALLAGEVWTGTWFRILVAFDVIFVVVGWLTFGFVVQE